MDIYDLTTLDNLNDAFYKSSKVSHWKASTQKYLSNLLPNNIELQDDLRNNQYKIGKTTDFIINERGKKRFIQAPNMRDRIVQKILCTHILVPQLTKYLIYDNYASLKNRGTSFARKRIDILLRKYLKDHENGYLLKIDILKYFDNIRHQKLKVMMYEKLHTSSKIFNLLSNVIDKSSYTNCGLNLGSEAPQIFAVYYLTLIDNYVKTVKRIKYYGRYMDDIFIISNDKEELKTLLKEIEKELYKICLRYNKKKTYITKLSHGFTFMQIKYNIKNGKIIKRPTHGKIVRERRRLKKYKKLYNKGIMSEYDIYNMYKSWRNAVVKDCNRCKKSISEMDKLYKQLFPNHEKYIKETRESIIYKAYQELAKDRLLHVIPRSFR